jgi:hypothetical protein
MKTDVKKNWIIEEYLGIKFKYVINKDSKTYSLKIITHIPRGYYYSYLNEIGLMIEQRHWEDLKT